MTRTRRLTLNCTSNLCEIRQLLVRAEGFARAHGLPPETCADLALVLAELLTNIARHGYGHDKGAIRCTISLCADGVICDLRDSGIAYDPRALGQRLPDPSLLQEGGYGWFLIHQLTQDLCYTRAAPTNRLQFRITATGTPRCPGLRGEG